MPAIASVGRQAFRQCWESQVAVCWAGYSNVMPVNLEGYDIARPPHPPHNILATTVVLAGVDAQYWASKGCEAVFSLVYPKCAGQLLAKQRTAEHNRRGSDHKTSQSTGLQKPFETFCSLRSRRRSGATALRTCGILPATKVEASARLHPPIRDLVKELSISEGQLFPSHKLLDQHGLLAKPQTRR